MTMAFFDRNVPDEFHQKMSEFAANGDDVICVAFQPGGNDSWSIVTKSGAYFNRNIPNECHLKMGELSQNAKIVHVAFPPQGGNSWSVVNDQGVYYNRNIPNECHLTMGELSQSAKIVVVAFPPQGGNSWSVVNATGAYFNRNVPDEADMYMGYLSEVYGPVRIVAFDPAGGGWSLASPVTITENVCDDTGCVAIVDVYNNIATRLQDNVVGYACTVGRASLGGFSHGQARTNADAPSRMFLPSTKIPVASVSKVVTALAAIRVLASHNVSLDSSIGGHLPSDWHLDSHVSSITFRELLSHRSGIKDYGSSDNSYAKLKGLFTQAIDMSKNSKCTGANVIDPPNPINPNDKNPCYSNYNFAIFRVLLPMIDGFVDDPANRAQVLADAYIRIVQKNVFEPVGASGVDAKPPATGPQATGYAFSYQYPGAAKGTDWGDDSLQVGAAGWYLSIDDIAKVLYSLNVNDGRILTSAQLQDMISTPLGWDTASLDSAGYRWVEKNGGWSSSTGTSISTSIALFGPGVFGALFMNSDILGPGLQNGWQWCAKCQALAFTGSAGPGACPGGGVHDHTGSGNYFVQNGGTIPPGGQDNWRWCNKCQALCFGGGATLGPCPTGGMHDHAGSGDYVLAQIGGVVPPDSQDNWQWCNKCMVLAHVGGASVGPCAAGGQHDHTGSGDYAVGQPVGADTVLFEAYQKALKAKAG